MAYELEDALRSRGKTEELEQIQNITRLGQFAYVRQGEPLGLGHAVLCARNTVGNEPFALLLGDDVFDEADPALGALIAAFEATGKSVVGVQEVPLAHVSRYGIVNPPAPGRRVVGGGPDRGEAGAGPGPQPLGRGGALRAHARGLRPPEEGQARGGRRIPAHRRPGRPGRRGPAGGRAHPRPALRHRATSWTTSRPTWSSG